ncbi:MAG: arginyltransferase [Nitrospinales bacterium]
MLVHFIDSKPFQCGYLNDQQSFFEEYILEDVSEQEFDYLLAHGMRHFGDYFFRPRCVGCHACVPIRVRPEEFRISRGQKRVLGACRSVRVKVGAPRFTEEKFRLYLKHKKRFPSLQQDVEDLENFKLSFYDESSFGIEFEYYDGRKLIGAALADFTKQALSAVYTFYDALDSRMSLGTFSILKQLEFSKERGVKYFYLGYFMLRNQSLRYKAAFKPNEVYIGGKWIPYRIPKLGALIPEEMLQWKNAESLVKEVSPLEKRA